MRSRNLLRYAPGVALMTAALAAVASAVAVVLGPGAAYAEIFPPPWLGIVGAALTAAALALRSLGARGAEAASWSAAVILLGASGGAVLDAFRAFFAVTGIPAGAFSEVDVPGFAARASALLAAFAAVTLARRIRGDRPRRIGQDSSRMRAALLVLGLVACLPYPLLKTVWWAEGGGFEVGFPTMEIALFAVAALGLVLLTTRVGRRFPRWLLSLGGWTASLTLLSMGGLMVFGLLAQVTHVAAASVAFEGAGRSAIVFAVYGTWLLLGAIIAAATVLHEERDFSTRSTPATTPPD